MLIHLQAAGTSLVLDARGPRPPLVVHWGAALDDLADADLAALADAAVPAVPPSSLDEPLRLTMLPGQEQGWSGRPAISGAWASCGTARAQWRTAGVTRPAASTVLVELLCTGDLLKVTMEIELSPQGVLRVRHRLTNQGTDTFDLASLDILLPVPPQATEILDFSGVWAYERRPQRAPLRDGVWSRETRHGRPGHGVPDRLPEVGPQPRPAAGGNGPPADHRPLPAADRPAATVPAHRGRKLRLRRRPDRPRHPRPRRPGMDLRHQRPPRTAADPW